MPRKVLLRLSPPKNNFLLWQRGIFPNHKYRAFLVNSEE